MKQIIPILIICFKNILPALKFYIVRDYSFKKCSFIFYLCLFKLPINKFQETISYNSAFFLKLTKRMLRLKVSVQILTNHNTEFGDTLPY